MEYKTRKIKAGIIGGAGYTGGELLRILLNHPKVDITYVHSRSNVGKFIYEVHPDLLGETDLIFSKELAGELDVLFLCVGHGEAHQFLSENSFKEDVRLIDLSQDFRIEEQQTQFRNFVYGLPELNRSLIAKAKNIANPGCFATAIQLSLLPLASMQRLVKDVHISGVTGSSGAGGSLSETSHFSWRNNNISTYKIFEHQHLKEINQSLRKLQPGGSCGKIYFVPYRGNFTRGIWTTSYIQTDLTFEESSILYKNYYSEHPFIHISTTNPHLKQVINTNKCILYLEKHEDNLVVTSIIDNLLKGASGQAVQNMNLMFGMEETLGLRLKATAF